MKFSASFITLLATSLVSAAAIEERATTGACCTAGVSKKQDACTDGVGAAGKCVPANSAGCGAALTCIANAALTCDNNQLENGKPLCRPTA